MLLLPPLLLSVLALEASALPQLDDMTLVQHLLVTNAQGPFPRGRTEDVNSTSGLAAGRTVVNAGFRHWQTTQVADVPVTLPERRPLAECQIFPVTRACLPSFMVIGVQKSGTSSLYQILKTHPQVHPAKYKELLWFNGNVEEVRCNPPNLAPTPQVFARYLSAFPKFSKGSGKITGEFSATYLHCWCCPTAIKRLMPKLRLIVLLRDPIERARSRWREQHSWAHVLKTYNSFEEYVARELPGLEGCLVAATGRLELQVHCLAKWNILGLSIYDTVLSLWLQHFEPENIFVAYTEQFEVSPQAVLSGVHAHLGIQDKQYPKSLLQSKYNKQGHYGWNMTNLAKVPSAAPLERLYEFYLPHMQQLKRMADLGLISKLPRSWVARWSL